VGRELVGGAIGLHLVMLLLPSDDDVAGVLAGVDESAEYTHRGVVEVALPMLLLLDYVLLAFSVLCISNLAAFVSHTVFIFPSSRCQRC
jgi:hypothetical protein